MPIQSLIEFEITPGSEKAFEAAYLQHGFLERARGRRGFLGGEFLRKLDGASTFWAIALWETEDDYKAWQAAYFDVFSANELEDLAQHLATSPQGFVTQIISATHTQYEESHRAS